MSKFTDAKSREWLIDLDPLVIDDVFKELTISLYTLTDNGMKALQELLENTPVFCNLVYILVRDQAREAGIDEREFMRGMKGDALEEMGIAFYKALAEFYPKKKRELMMQALNQMSDHQNQLMPMMQKRLTKELQKRFGELSVLLVSDTADLDSSS